MTARTALVLAGFAVAVTTVACGGGNMAMQGTAEDEAAIRGLPDRYVAAYNAKDATGIAALAADDYQAVAPDGTAINGKAGVEQMLSAEMQMNQKMNIDVTLGASMDFLHWLSAESAAVGGSWTVTGVPEGQPNRGSWLAVVHKSPDGQWLLTSDLAAPHLEPPAPETTAPGAN